MKGHVYRRGKSWSYLFDIEPDPLTGKRRQANGSGFKTERAAWKACRDAITEYERGQVVTNTRRKVAVALEEWLSRIEHSIKPSMARNWRNYAAYYVNPYIGDRDVWDISGEVCDALYKKLLAEGRIKAKPKTRPAVRPVHARRLAADGHVLPCRPYRYDGARCYRRHAEDDPAIGQPMRLRKSGSKTARDEGSRKPLPPGLEPKTVVNAHRMLHRAWEDFTVWGWAKRNVIADAHPPRACLARAAGSGQLRSCRPSCSARGVIGSSHCGCSKRPPACGGASWRDRSVTCSTPKPEPSTSDRPA